MSTTTTTTKATTTKQQELEWITQCEESLQELLRIATETTELIAKHFPLEQEQEKSTKNGNSHASQLKELSLLYLHHITLIQTNVKQLKQVEEEKNEKKKKDEHGKEEAIINQNIVLLLDRKRKILALENQFPTNEWI